VFPNACVFALELVGGEAFVTNWSAIPAQIVSGHHWITIITAMFLHGCWSHIIDNMIFLWAFGPESKTRWALDVILSSTLRARSRLCLLKLSPILIQRFPT